MLIVAFINARLGEDFQLQKKAVLKNVSGDCKPGEILAILGPSGAFYCPLACFLFTNYYRLRKNYAIGYIVEEENCWGYIWYYISQWCSYYQFFSACRWVFIYRSPKVVHHFQSFTTLHFRYVYQDDVLLETLTVREHLEYIAMLRLPEYVPWASKQQKVSMPA